MYLHARKNNFVLQESAQSACVLVMNACTYDTTRSRVGAGKSMYDKGRRDSGSFRVGPACMCVHANICRNDNSPFACV